MGYIQGDERNQETLFPVVGSPGTELEFAL